MSLRTSQFHDLLERFVICWAGRLIFFAAKSVCGQTCEFASMFFLADWASIESGIQTGTCLMIRVRVCCPGFSRPFVGDMGCMGKLGSLPRWLSWPVESSFFSQILAFSLANSMTDLSHRLHDEMLRVTGFCCSCEWCGLCFRFLCAWSRGALFSMSQPMPQQPNYCSPPYFFSSVPQTALAHLFLTVLCVSLFLCVGLCSGHVWYLRCGTLIYNELYNMWNTWSSPHLYL